MNTAQRVGKRHILPAAGSPQNSEITAADQGQISGDCSDKNATISGSDPQYRTATEQMIAPS
jgi:hypothetical protein